NVIPGTLEARFNFRYSTESTPEGLKGRVETILDRQPRLDWHIDWHDSGRPFLSPADGRLRTAVMATCRDLLHADTEESTGGGTSDGRFMAPLGAEVVELGPVNATIHKADECVAVAELNKLPDVYAHICKLLLAGA